MTHKLLYDAYVEAATPTRALELFKTRCRPVLNGTPDPVPCEETLDFLNKEWAEFMKPTYVNNNGQTKKTTAEAWRQANPGEWRKLQNYRANGGEPPLLVSSIGKQMVEHVSAWRSVQEL